MAKKKRDLSKYPRDLLFREIVLLIKKGINSRERIIFYLREISVGCSTRIPQAHEINDALSDLHKARIIAYERGVGWALAENYWKFAKNGSI